MKDFGMSEEDININRSKIHVCNVCKRNFYWTDESCWYGKFYEEDEKIGNHILKKCCDKKCFQRSKYKDKK